MFLRLVRLEMARSLRGGGFLLACGVGLALAILMSIERLPTCIEQLEEWPLFYLNTSLSATAFSSYNVNLLVDPLSAGSNLFFFLAPALILTAYAWSAAADLDSGLAAQVVCRAGRARWYFTKYCAAFVSGGLVVAIPLAASWLISSLFLPSYTPDIYDQTYLAIDDTCILGSLFFRSPALFMAGRIALDFLFAGTWATFILSLSLFGRRLTTLFAIPYLLLLGGKEIVERAYVLAGVRGPALTLFDQLRGCPTRFMTWDWVTALEMTLMFSLSLLIPLALRRRDLI